MSKKNTMPTSRHHVVIFDETWAYLERKYGPGSHLSHIGVSKAIRTILHQRVQGMKQKESGAVDRLRDEQRDTGDSDIHLGDEK